ncbi:MAG: multidrug efflux SMR transporter [Candidatus Brocadia sp.]|nr:MAG: multidrug efflux SMR transporter [Candidatus Brocadia sp.]
MVLAILLEVSGTMCLKLSQGFTKIVPSVLLFIFYGFSFTALSLALRKVDVSVAYAVWSGLGTILIATVGIVWFREPLNALKIISIVLIVLGMIGLRLSGGMQ